MRILDRYILDSVIKTFVGCLLLFFFLYIIIDIFAHLDEVLKQRVSILILKDYYLLYLPIIFVQTAPVVCLLATTYTLNRLNIQNEIIAMRSAGLSIWQITKSILVFGILISAFVFVANDKYVPLAQARTEKIKQQMFEQKTSAQEEVIKNMAIYGLKNRLFFISNFDGKNNLMEGITILEHDEQQNLISKIIAAKGTWQNNAWKFYQYTKFQFDANAQIKGEPEFHDEQLMDIKESPRDFLRQRKLPEEMNIAQIKDYLFRLSKSGAHTVIRNLKVDLYQKIAFPFTSLVIVFVGIPFSLMTKKRASGVSSLAISAAICFLFYVSSAVSLALGKTGILPPLLAATSAHLAFIFLASYLIVKLP